MDWFESIGYFRSNGGLEGFIRDVDKRFDGEFAMIAARNEAPSSFYDALREEAKKLGHKGPRMVSLRLENIHGIVKSRFLLDSFTFDECRQLASEFGRGTFLYATGHDAPCEYDSQTGEAVFKADFRRTLAHWLISPKSHEVFTVSKQIDPVGWMNGMALASEHGREKCWSKLFEISNKRLPRKGPKVICVNDRFVWHAESYKGWSEFLRADDRVCIIPYQGWTPELLVGNGAFFFEVWKNARPEELLQPGDLCICGEPGGVLMPVDDDDKPIPPEFYEGRKWFSVYRRNDRPPYEMSNMADDKMTLEAAFNLVLNLNGHKHTHFTPSVVCTKGKGNLKALMDDPQSTFIIASCWKPLRIEGDMVVPVDARDNTFDAPPVLNLFGHVKVAPYDDENLQGKNRRKKLFDLQQKCSFSTFNLRCGGRSVDSLEPLIHNPCWNYIVSDFKSDGVCFVLKPGYSKEGFEGLKEAIMDRLAFLGIEALFVKEREECYALGCREKELVLQHGMATIRFPKNRGERLPLGVMQGIEPLAERVSISLFAFLHKLYNHGKQYGFSELTGAERMRTYVRVPYIEEEIYRGSVRREGCGITDVMAYRYACRPVRRSQWERIYN